jgi:hypothetical protein
LSLLAIQLSRNLLARSIISRAIQTFGRNLLTALGYWYMDIGT